MKKSFKDFIESPKMKARFEEIRKKNEENEKYYNETLRNQHLKPHEEPSDFVKLMVATYGNGYKQTENL